MKKFLVFILICFFFILPASAKKKKKAEKPLPKNVMAPALQFNKNDYQRYFKNQTIYAIEMKTKSQYKITCNDDIIGVNWDDIDNIHMYDIKDKNGDIIDMKTVFIKTKNESYSYIMLYKESGEIMNIKAVVNPVVNAEKEANLGLCRLYPYEDED